MPHNKFNISMPEEITNEIASRGDNRSEAIARSLDRYFAILETSRRALAEKFDKRECGLILDALNGCAFVDTISLQLVYANIEDSLSDGLDKKWKVGGKELVKKLRALTYAENAALVDAAERWWNRVGNGERPDYDELFKKRKKE
jgi:hypothetical protein